MTSVTNDFDAWPLGPVDRFVGRRIRALRDLLNIMPQQMAGALGLSSEEIDAIELGKRHLRPDEMISAASFLHVTPMFFFAGFDETLTDDGGAEDAPSTKPLHA